MGLASMLDQLGLMDKDNKNYTEGEDNLEMEANDIELPSPDLVELAPMLDEDSSNNNNNTEGEDNMEPADDNADLYFCFKKLTDANIFIILYGVTSIYFAGM